MRDLENPTTLPDDEVDISALLQTLWNGKFWIVLAALIGLALGGYYTLRIATPYYTATSVVMLESRQEQVVDIESVVTGLGGDQLTINTEVEVLQSRGLIRKLVDELGLIDDPEFNGYLQEPSRFSIGGVIGLVLGSDDDPEPVSEETILNGVVNNVLGTISVANVRQSYVFQITAVTQSPEKSALIANTLADLYILDQLEAKFQATEQATEWLSGRVSELQAALENAVGAVKDFNAETDLISPETLSLLNRQLKEQRDRLTDIRAAQVAAQGQLTTLNAAISTNDLTEIARIAEDRTFDRLLTAQANGQEGAEAAIATRIDQIRTRISQEEARARQQIATLTTAIAELENQITRQSADLVTLQQLEREAEASRLIYEFFLNRLKETSVQQGIQQADSRVLSRAVIPGGPSAPRHSVFMMISLVMGGLLASAGLIIRELLQNTFRTAEDLESHTGITVMGQIPQIPARHRRGVLDYLSEKPTSAASEAIRNLRTSLLLSNMDQTTQIIMSTSSVPGEGKTTQSIALAQNLSGLGKKVLLVEGDIRRRVFSEYFSIDKDHGLLAVLAGDVTLDEAITHNDQLGADILTGEKSNINATDVFSSQRFKDLLRDMRAQYDYVIIDTPPVLAVPDARVIGQWVDAILYTVKWDETSRQQVSEGLRSLESVNIRVSGLVLGQINLRGMRRYGYGKGYKDYQGYYDN
ncbi:capsular exopolysaccharide synthesis family protein [Rubricella aquisinus]|uniref:non-specific protein-tyrosine kinase n=1 Tax=Rubricella aquisinus TaxID=2028108 RepID=A0A840WK61_9RHOB|nr:polysaccharide biosynthesis tyrosine autokinase [Rubricella aquisinus]MBB5514563.1 capsular exopolysaccharide synthesis family protein [Rubricella aquisinus]